MSADLESLDANNKSRQAGTRRANHSTMENYGYAGNFELTRKTRFLSTIMDLSRVESIKTIDTNEKNTQIFVETSDAKDGQMNANNA